MDRIFEFATHIFDYLHNIQESKKYHTFVGIVLVAAFVGALGAIELGRQGMLPPEIASKLPTSHFYAVNLAFTLVLFLEVIALIFVLPCSLSKSVGKQLEILALILLRNAFKELVHFPEPVALSGHEQALYNIVAYALGSLAVFALIGVYYALQPRNRHEIQPGEPRYRFVAAKKAISLLLLASFIGMVAIGMIHKASHGGELDCFARFYTLLIFSDILLVLISQQFLPKFHSIYRNSGYALCTLILRLALTASPYVMAAMSAGASLFAVALTLAYNTFFSKGGKYSANSSGHGPSS